MAEENVFDGIIIGGGHNGLILQTYLARASLRTLTVEKNSEVGGGLSTVEDTLGPMFGVHLSLTEPPRYAGRSAHADLDHALMTILRHESPEHIYGLLP